MHGQATLETTENIHPTEVPPLNLGQTCDLDWTLARWGSVLSEGIRHFLSHQKGVFFDPRKSAQGVKESECIGLGFRV